MEINVNRVASIAKEINGRIAILSDIHDELFSFSLRKIIPIPFFFKKIDFDGAFLAATSEAKALAELSQWSMNLIEESDGHSISMALDDYTNSAIMIALKLAAIIDVLMKKRDGEKIQNGLYEADISEYEVLLENNEKNRLKLINILKRGPY